jgi:hypothetical protein
MWSDKLAVKRPPWRWQLCSARRRQPIFRPFYAARSPRRPSARRHRQAPYRSPAYRMACCRRRTPRPQMCRWAAVSVRSPVFRSRPAPSRRMGLHPTRSHRPHQRRAQRRLPPPAGREATPEHPFLRRQRPPAHLRQACRQEVGRPRPRWLMNHRPSRCLPGRCCWYGCCRARVGGTRRNQIRK